MSKTKSISFDLADPLEEKLLKHAEKEFDGKKRNFSRYVKRLIQADMLSGGAIESFSSEATEDKNRNTSYTLEV
ncbi:hypothetical protein PVJ1_00037 [Psychrobacillus phage PVJ1]|nr:hypothetical protein PVJ1_00037 [Psychrobacillus phage PVJ1]